MTPAGFCFDHFEVGDYVVFQRSYSLRDFEAFSGISGDTNPLHHDAAFAGRTSFGRPIVPLHLALAPLSMIAGMVFPGEASLYLGHEVRAALPVYYDEAVRYSARIESINASHRVLGLRVLALRGSEVVLDASMRVQARTDRWGARPAFPIHKGSRPALAVITGAAGEIGGAVAHALARQGWRLLLHDRGDAVRRRELQARLLETRVEATFVAADLATGEGAATLAAAVAARDDVGLIIHAASPGVASPVAQLVAVNFSALDTLVAAALPQMLARQKAAVVLIGSSAVEYALPGWEAYTGAKSMAGSLINGVERRNAAYGVRGLMLMPDLVATRFSEAFRGDKPALLPQEVAEALWRMLNDENAPGNAVMLKPGRYQRGLWGFFEPRRGITSFSSPSVDAESRVATQGNTEHPLVSPVDPMLRKFLRLAADADLAGAGLGLTSGWDSLRHIEILLEIEKVLGIHFSSEEIATTHRFSTLDALCRKKLVNKADD